MKHAFLESCFDKKMSNQCVKELRMTEKWIDINEAAEFLDVKVGTIRTWIRKGKDIPAHKVGKQWKFKCSELDEWVKSGKSAIE